MILAVTAYAVLGILVRLAGQTLHPFEIAFFRSLIGALFVVPIILSVGFSVFRTHHPKLNIARSLTSLIALLAGFTGLAYLPTAEAMTVHAESNPRNDHEIHLARGNLNGIDRRLSNPKITRHQRLR